MHKKTCAKCAQRPMVGARICGRCLAPVFDGGPAALLETVIGTLRGEPVDIITTFDDHGPKTITVRPTK